MQSHKSQMKTPPKHFPNFLLLMHSAELGLKVFLASELLGSPTEITVPPKKVFLGPLADDDHQQGFTCDHHC